MKNRDDQIYLEYIRKLLLDAKNAKLDRDALSGETEELTDSLMLLGKSIKDEKRKQEEFSDVYNEMLKKMERQREKIEKISNIDDLTGVENRRAYNREVDCLWRQKQNFSIAFIDIDGLKSCNYNYGHSEGDKYINSVCSKLQKVCGDGEKLYRMGGDEFLILSVKDSAKELSDRLMQAHIEYRAQMQKKVEYTCDFSFGCADMDANGAGSASEYLSLADREMYNFKIQNYMNHKHMDSYKPHDLENVDKSGLDNRIFEVFCSTASNRYAYICNLETNISRWSPQAVRDFGLPAEYMYGADKIWEKRIHPDDRGIFRQDIVAVFSGRKPYHDVEYRARLRDGTYVRCTCEGCVLRGKTPGEPDLFAGTLTNHGVVDYVDPVTGLNNVYSFLRDVRHRSNKREGAFFLVIGMNQYSDINNAFGYQIGDRALKCFADLLNIQIPEKMGIFRLDGTKFVLILPAQQQKNADEIFRQITVIAETQVEVKGKHIPLSVSGAAMLFEHIAVSEMTVLTELIQMLRMVKSSGITGLYQYSREKAAEAQKKMLLLDTVKDSVLYGCKDFYLVYQPQVNRDSKVLGVECLLRWRNEEYGTVPPIQFIPWLEKDSCFYILGLWILRTAVREIKKIVKENPDFTLSVNVSYRQFENAKFIGDVFMILEEEDFPKNNLILELTEHCRSLNPQFLKRFMGEFHRQGIRISADDFGTGYSSFSLMRELPFDCIKIDQSFIRNILSSPEDQVMVESIIRCARTRKLPVCIEGIETMEIFDFVRKYDPGYYQGYLFAKPMGIEDFYVYMKDR